MNTILALTTLHGLVYSTVILILVLVITIALIYCIEKYVNKGPLPPAARLVIVIVLVAIVILWALSATTGYWPP